LRPYPSQQYLAGLLDPAHAGVSASGAGAPPTPVDDAGPGPAGLPSVRMAELHETYIELMCQFEPHRVYAYLPTTERCGAAHGRGWRSARC